MFLPLFLLYFISGCELNGKVAVFLPTKASPTKPELVKPEIIHSKAPTILNISSLSADGFYTKRAIIPIVIHFSEPVVASDPDSLSLTLETGETDAVAAYFEGSGTDTLVFHYLVSAMQNSSRLELASKDSLRLNGSSLTDLSGNSVPLILPIIGAASLSSQKNLTIDTVEPEPPLSVGFANSHTFDPTFDVSWSNGSDINFDTHTVKLCSSNDCLTGCGAEKKALSSPVSEMGDIGKTYFACVQSRDLAGNVSRYTTSLMSLTIDPPPVFAGVSSGEVLGSWSDGSGKVELTFHAEPAFGIARYRIYYSPTNTVGSFDFNSPIATLDRGDVRFDPLPHDKKLLISVPISNLRDGYYIVRYYDATGTYTDTNTSISTLVNVLSGQAGYLLVPKLYSGLSYDYFIMKYEASLSSSGTNVGLDTVSTVEANVASCAYKFQQDGIAADSSCGTKNITKSALSLDNVMPQVSIPWATAFYACRNATTSAARVRLPTAEEWRRASQWIGTSYSSMWSTYSGNASTHCNVNAGSAANTGSAIACASGLGALDMAGNVKEWVDSRLAQYSIGGNGESRLSYGPTIARTIPNGLDNIVQRMHTLDPGAGGLALTLGADFKTPVFAGQKQYGADVQSWVDPTTSDNGIGFRCMGMRADAAATMTQLALPDEPKFTAADIPLATPSNWRIPENLFIKDNKWETLAITVNGNTSDAVAEGSVSLSWTPWTKTICDTNGSCIQSDAGLVYKIYRFKEPNRQSIRTATPWALVGPGSVYGTSGSDKPLNPLAVDAAGARLFSSNTSDGTLVASISNCNATSPASCNFLDSTTSGSGFSESMVYDYMLVVEDGTGNAIMPSVQRYRSPYFTGPPTVASAATFRMEPRYRRAAVFLVDESFQQALLNPQIMVSVPMDSSGLDHDFFIQKYEASAFSGTFSDNTPNGAADWPRQSSVSAWNNYAALCFDTFLQTGEFDLLGCGDGTTVAATNLILSSAQGSTPVSYIDQGNIWKACRNSSVVDGGGFVRKLSLLTDPEYLKASDWGDLDQDGFIDQSVFAPNVGANINSLESGPNDSTTVRCHTDNDPATLYSSNVAATANCRSRYGVADLVGNAWERTTGQHANGYGNDDGVDGLWYGLTSIGNSSTWDLLRALPAASGASISLNSDGWYQSGHLSSNRGGSFNNGDGSGRWMVDLDDWGNPSDVRGGRCTY